MKPRTEWYFRIFPLTAWMLIGLSTVAVLLFGSPVVLIIVAGIVFVIMVYTFNLCMKHLDREIEQHNKDSALKQAELQKYLDLQENKDVSS